MRVDLNFAPSLTTQALLDFVNIQEINAQSFNQFCNKHGIQYYFSSEDKVYRYCMTRLSPLNIYLFDPIESNYIETSTLRGANTGVGGPGSVPYEKFNVVNSGVNINDKITDENGNYDIWWSIDSLQGQLETFLNNCIKYEMFDVQFLSRAMVFSNSFSSVGDLLVSESDDPWLPTCIPLIKLKYIEDVILFQCIIKPIMFRETVQFSKIKKCENCGIYYIYTSKRSRFCSDKCRMQNHYKKKTIKND